MRAPVLLSFSYESLALNDLTNPQMNRARLVMDNTINIVTVDGGSGTSPMYDMSMRRATTPA